MIKHDEYGTAHEEHLSFNCAYCLDEIIEKLTEERDRYKKALEEICRFGPRVAAQVAKKVLEGK